MVMPAPAGQPVAGAASVSALAAAALPSAEAIGLALAGVPDPEIPAVSVVDLGMIRHADWDPGRPGTLVVGVTPTYAGCPATAMIMAAIRDALAAVGVPAVEIDVLLSPPWTTDWITEAGRRKLAAYGIAPPGGAAPHAGTAQRVDISGLAARRADAPAVACPRCGSAATRLVAQFGSTACKALYRCTDCLEPFDYFKPY